MIRTFFPRSRFPSHVVDVDVDIPSTLTPPTSTTARRSSREKATTDETLLQSRADLDSSSRSTDTPASLDRRARRTTWLTKLKIRTKDILALFLATSPTRLASTFIIPLDLFLFSLLSDSLLFSFS